MRKTTLFLRVLCFCFVLVSPVEAQQQTQSSETKSVIALVTLLDGSTQEWKKVEFVYADRTLSHLEYVAGAFGSMVINDRVAPEPGVSIKAEYSDQLEFKDLVLTAKPEIDNRVIGTNCASTPCIEAGIRLKGSCQVSGEARDCSVYLIPARGSKVTNKANFIKDINFVLR
ncbi:MAG TPA: hypothetical protein VGL29_10940 [Blastocatellia bacterium]|jgi:hypothetical protein